MDERYLSLSNLKRALVASLAVTLLSVPRLIQGRMELDFFVPATFASMLIISGAMTAWCSSAGMIGLFPGRRRAWVGVGAGLGLACVATVLYVAWINPMVYPLLRASCPPAQLRLLFPATLSGCFAATLWAAGFETVLFVGAPVSFFARLLGNRWAAILASALFRGYAGWLHLHFLGVGEALPLIVGAAVALNLLATFLFSATGLAGAVAFAVGMNLHHFARVLLAS